MRLLIILITTIISHTTFCQVVNSVSPDKTGMFYYSVDSLIQKIKKDKKIETIFLSANFMTIQEFPEAIRNIRIVKLDKTKKHLSKNLSENEILFKLNELTIIRDQVSLTIWTFEKKDKRMTLFADGSYIFNFKYLPETRTFKLTHITSGFP